MSQLPPASKPESPYHPPQKSSLGKPAKNSGKAVASLVFGIGSFLCFLISGLLGLIFGALALRDIANSEGRVSGTGMAITGMVLSVVGTICSFGILIGLTLPAVQQVREASRRTVTQDRLRTMAIGMHNYHDSYRRLPAVASADNDFGSKLSWRVQILPFIGQSQLHDQFNHNEPWDSPTNLPLVEKMPEIFKSTNHDLEPGKTNFVIPVTRIMGKEQPDSNHRTAFIPGRKTTLETLQDGASGTILIVEVNPEAAVIWTKPQDWEFNPDKPMQDLDEARPGGFCVAMADGSAFFISNRIMPEKLKALFTSAGGEQIDSSELKR